MKDEERTPLRTVLINFLNHIENLESEKFPEKSYESEFQDLKLFSESVKGLKEYSCLEGEKEVNRKKNRYKDILPFDVSRVILNEYAGIPGSDYINANYIKGASGSIAYIASQGPLPNTINDFWRMVVQCEVQVIVMACNEEEAGKTKCEKYWVEDKEEKQFGMVSVKLLKASTVCPDFSVRTMRLKYTNSQSVVEERTVCQLHYVAWPDHGVPSVVQPLLDMVRLVRDTQASETLPVLIHCSAGCGRTGTICAIDYVWGLLRTGKLTKDFSLLGLVREMRRQRIAMVQTKEQYVLVHQAVRELFKEQLNMIDSHPYENVDSNGMIRLKEEPLYDVVGGLLSNNSNEEKRDDKKEKEVIAPPIPLKRRPSVLSSKEEKEVENLTARQKLLELADSGSESVTSSSTGSGQTSKIDKLKSQFEMNPECMPNNPFKKLSLSTTKKCDLAQPIPSRGVLKVPQLEVKSMKPISVVKRSKSLKLLSSEERYKLVVCNENLSQGRRRSSLESNLEEPQADRCVQYDNNQCKVEKVMNPVQESKHVCQIVKDYEALCLLDRRPLGRSYTTLDMRQKPVLNTKYKEDTVVSSAVSSVPVKSRRKISRSHTQLELKNAFQKTESSKNSGEICDGEFLTKQDFYDFTHCENVPLYYDIKYTTSSANTSSNWTPKNPSNKVKEPNRSDICHDERIMDEISVIPPKLHLAYSKKNERINKELEMKPDTVCRGSNRFLISSNQTRMRHCNFDRFRADSSKYVSEDQSQYMNINGNCGDSLQVLNKDIYSRVRSTPHEQIFLKTRDKSHKKPKDQDMKFHWDHQSKIQRNDDRIVFPSRSTQEPIYTNMKFKESNECNVPKSIRFNRSSQRPVEPNISPKNLNVGSPSCSLEINGRYSKKVHIPLRRDPNLSVISKHTVPSSRHFQTPPKSKGTDMNKSSSTVQTSRALLSSIKSKPNCSSYFGPRDKMNDRSPAKIEKSLPQEAVKVLLDASVSHMSPEDKISPRPDEYVSLGPDSCTPNHGTKLRYASQDDHAMTASVAACSSKVKRHTSVVLQRPSKSADPAHWSIWTGGEQKITTPPSQHNWDCDQPWQSAPGVDIDQVAASISQKEGSRNKLIKAALEALHIRKSKQSAETSDHPSGAAHLEQSKKQEYL